MQILSAITCLAAISVASHHDLPAIKEGEHKVHKTTLSQSTSDIDAEITSRPTHMLKGASKQVDSMWDSVSNLWDDAKDIYDAHECSQYDTAEECAKNECDMCRGGTILQQLYQMGKIPAVISGSISEAQLKSGDLCGVGETYCGAFTKYFNALPSLLIKALGYLHVTIPEFCPKGVCKTSGVGESVAASFVGLAAFLYAAL